MKNLTTKKNIYISICIAIVVICIIVCIVVENNKSNVVYETVDAVNTENSTDDNVSKEQENKIYVHVSGEVNNPGLIEACNGDRIIDVIEKAGGFTTEANVNKINFAYQIEDGQKIIIPNINENAQQNEDEEHVVFGAGENVVENDKYNSKININKATQTELETLSGIGPSMANKIIKYRDENGRFKTIEDLKNVPGIGEAKYNSIKDEIIAK